MKWLKGLVKLLGLILVIVVVLCLYKSCSQENISEFDRHDTDLSFKSRLIETASEQIPGTYDLRLLTPEPGLELRATHWTPSDTLSAGTIMLMHGFSEFTEKYYEVIGHLLARGYQVVTFDWRGQGLSSRLLANHDKYHIISFDHLLSDADHVYQEMMQALRRPHAILAHSMGGHLTSRLLQTYPDRYDRAVLVSPMMQLPILSSESIESLASFISGIGFRQSYIIGGADGDPDKSHHMLTNNEEKFESVATLYKKEPELLIGAPTWQWFEAAGRSMTESMTDSAVKKIKTPTLIVSTTDDQIVDPAAHRVFQSKNQDNIELLTLDNAEHEILMETDSIQGLFWTAFDSFMQN